MTIIVLFYFDLSFQFRQKLGLTLFNIHRHRDIQVDEVIDMFAVSKKRCMNL